MKRAFTLLTIIFVFHALNLPAQNSTCAAPSGPLPLLGEPAICYDGYTVENTGPLTQYYTFVASTPAMQVLLLPVVGTACSFPNTAITYSNLRLYQFGDCTTPIASGALFFGLTPGDTYVWGCTMTPVDPVCVWIAEACPTIVPSPLPIGLNNFEAMAASGHVNLNWSIATPGSYEHFTVERSSSPDVGFEKAGTVNAETPGQLTFGFQDEMPASAERMFYRLVLRHQGVEEFSQVVAVNLTEDPERWMTIYPNPTFGASDVLINGEQLVSFRITDQRGQIGVAADKTVLRTWMETAPAGMYIIEGVRAGEKQIFRWVKM